MVPTNKAKHMTGKKRTASKSKHECKQNISFANVLQGGDCGKTRHTMLTATSKTFN